MTDDELSLYKQITSDSENRDFSSKVANLTSTATSMSIANKFIFKLAAECHDAQNFDKTSTIFLNIFCPTLTPQSIGERIRFAKEGGHQADLALQMLLLGNFEELFSNFNSFEIDQKTTFEMCKLVSQFPRYIPFLLNNFDKIGLENAPIEQLLSLFKEIARQGGAEISGSLAKLIMRMDLINKISGLNDITQRIDLSNKFIALGDSFALLFFLDFDKFGVKNASLDECVKLCNVYANHGGAVSSLLPSLCGKLGIIEKIAEIHDIGQRIDACEKIAAHGEWAAEFLIENFEKLGIENAPLEQRMPLYRLMIKQGDNAATTFTNRFQKLGTNIPENQRIELSRTIAKQGPEAKIALAHNLKKLGLESTTIDQRLELCNEMLKDANLLVIFPLLKNLQFLHLDDTALIKLGGYAISLELQIAFFNNRFFSLISNEVSKKQVLLDLLKSKADLSVEYDFAYSLDPITNILKNSTKVVSQEQIDSLNQFISKNSNIAFLGLILKSILENEKPELWTSLIRWIAYSAGVLNDLKLTPEQVPLVAKMINHIYQHRNPNNRYLFTRALSDLIHQYPDELKSMTPKNKNDWMPFSRLITSQLKARGLSPEVQGILLNCLMQTPGFVDTKQFTLLTKLISALALGRSYEEKELDTIIKGIINIFGEIKPINLPKPLPEMDAKKPLDRKKLLGLIDTFLNPVGDKVPNKMEITNRRKEALIDYIDGLIEGNKYITKNTEAQIESRMPKISDIDIKLKLEEYLKRFEPKAVDKKNTPANKIVDVRNEPSRKDEFKRVINGLSTYSNILEIFGKDELIKYLAENRDLQLIFQEHFKKLFDVEGVDNFNEKYLATIGQFSNPSAIFSYLSSINRLPEGEKQRVKDAFNSYIVAVLEGTFHEMRYSPKLSPHLQKINEEFPDLLNKWSNNELLPKKDLGQHKIMETDDPGDLLLMATVVQGSCQSVYGQPAENKCLVGYLINGDVRVIAVKGKENDTMAARCIIRLMWDEVNQCPVMLLEKTYSNIKDNAIEDAIITWAIEKANALRVVLVSKEIGSGIAYEGEVGFLGGLAPFVYSDASIKEQELVEGIQEGPFKVHGCHFL